MDPCTELFEAFRSRGDLAALGSLFDQLAPQLLPIALHLCGEPSAAEDALQQTFLLAIERAASFDASRRVEPWLVGLLTNVARNARRTGQRHRADGLPELAAESGDPASAAERRELIAHLRTHVAALPHEQRQAILLQLQHGMQPAEIAEVLDVQAGTVRMRLHRGLAALRRLLPASLAALLGGALATRGLAAVRGEVLRSAAHLVSPTVLAAVVPTVAAGASLAMKKLLTAVAILLAGAWLWLTLSGPTATVMDVATVPDSPALQANSPASAAREPSPERAAAESTPTPDARLGTCRVRVRAALEDGSTLPLASLFVIAWTGASDLAPLDASAERRSTDARGEVVLADLPPGPLHVALPAERGAARATQVAAGRESLLEIDLPVRTVLRGRVVDAIDRPIADAEIWLERGTYMGAFSLPEPTELGCRLAGRSDAAGRFAVAVVDHHESRVSASRAGYGESMGRYVNNTRDELRLVLLAQEARVRGVVRDALGAPVADALVTLTPMLNESRRGADGTLFGGRAGRQTRSARDGAFAFAGLAPSRVRVTATAYPRTPGSTELELAADAEATVELTLGAGMRVVGTLRYADRSPARAQISARSDPNDTGHFMHCDPRPDGSFELPHLPHRPMWVVAHTLQHTLASQRVEPQAGTVRCDLIAAGQPLRGRVVDAAGRPLAGWTVVALRSGSAKAEGTTAGDGAFLLALDDADEVTVVVLPRGAKTAAFEQHGVRPGKILELTVPLAALPTARVVGRALYADGRPAGQRRIELLGNRRERSTITAADGAFVFAELSAGEFTASLTGSGHDWPLGQPFTLTHGATLDLGELRLPAFATLLPEFVHGDGRPWTAEPPGIALYDARDQEVPVEHVWVDGLLRVTAPPGSYRFGIHATDLLAPELRVTLDSAAPTRLRVPLRIGRSLKLTCNADGAIQPHPEPPVRITVRDASGQLVLQREVQRLHPDLRGFRYAIATHTFAFGRYEAEAAARDGTLYRGTFTVDDRTDGPSAFDIPRRR